MSRTSWPRSSVSISQSSTASTCSRPAERAASRPIRGAGGIDHLLADPVSREAFAIANRVMARANRQRGKALNGKPPEAQKAPAWRLFQLAFVLLNLEALAEPRHPDRPVVDLLFFPTGGGKTEAYLGLAAFAIARRRLDHPGLKGAGCRVVMRYTLRLLTLDQLAARRRRSSARSNWSAARGETGSGDWPIEIGLWVGAAATPNTLGSAKNAKTGTAVIGCVEHRAKRGPAPAPLKACPWCGTHA